MDQLLLMLYIPTKDHSVKAIDCSRKTRYGSKGSSSGTKQDDSHFTIFQLYNDEPLENPNYRSSSGTYNSLDENCHQYSKAFQLGKRITSDFAIILVLVRETIEHLFLQGEVAFLFGITMLELLESYVSWLRLIKL